MAVFDSGKAKVLMPRQIADGIITRTQTLSTVAKLNGGIPTFPYQHLPPPTNHPL